MADTLIQALQSHDIPYDRSALTSALSDPSAQAWVHEYISSDTVLSKDEAALYASLCKTGEAETVLAQDLSMIQGLNSHEIESAIEELRRSTAAIEKQTEALRLQQSALAAITKTVVRGGEGRVHTEESQVRKLEVERGQVTQSIDELAEGLKFQLVEMEAQMKIQEKRSREVVDGVLREDDKFLLSLQKLATDLEPGSEEDEKLMGRVREGCARYIKFTVEGIRTRLDRIYLESLASESGSGQVGNNGEADVDGEGEVKEELESLYSEILPVAQMAAEQQFLELAEKMLEERNGKGQRRAVAAVDYINDCTTHLTARLSSLLSLNQESHSHNEALAFVLGTAKTELGRPEPAFSSNDFPVRPRLITKQKRSSGSQATLAKLKINRRSSGFMDEETDPLSTLCRDLGLTLPPSSQGTDDRERSRFLDKALAERKSKLETHTENLQSTTESSISNRLLDAHLTLDLLREELLVDTKFNTVSLVDRDLADCVDELEREVETTKEEIDGMDLYALQGRNVNREQFVQRWGR